MVRYSKAMSSAFSDSDQIVQQAMDALRRGAPAQARALLQGMANPPPMLLAQACARMGDMEGEEAALDLLLQQDKRHLPALLAMAGLKIRQGDDRAATTWYRAAINMAAVSPDVPPALHPLLEQAQSYLAQASDRFCDHLLADLNEAGIEAKGAVGQAIDLLLGRTQLFLQQPTMFYYPGLPQRAFYEREEMGAWVEEMEACTAALRDELEAVMAAQGSFDPYVTGTPGRPLPNNPLLDDPSWGALYFWKSGKTVADHADRCPQTMAALARAPMPRIDHRSPMALWSRLEPGTRIKPHHGLLNTRLICHLPLIVPEGCALRVGAETRAWKEGRMMIFDDSVEHEAWNDSTQTRVILLFEIWRPEIPADDRAALTALFQSIDRYSGPTQEGL